uniref:phage antirepressor KilAC domain-containing protein n=1 Tax=uncultured Dysgonomonas sp. TaxID=206096 RepID=UPI002615C27D|nr:phage antirepressor KilAC domain-containing protein [uncultured Dysgonomonas sp.]
MNIINYNYKGSEISFMSGNNVMINATQMAKPFNKRTNDWLSLKQTNELINSLSIKTGIPATDLTIVNQGGSNQGTWLYEDLALIFAQWLSPDFYLWCNDRIKELLKTGVATVSNDDEAIAYAMQVLNKRLEQSRAEKELLERQNMLLTNEIKEATPKVKCYNEYISSDGTYTTTQIAKEYGWGAETLNKKLASMGIQYKQNRQWILYAKYDGKGFTKSKPVTYPKSDGTSGTQMQTVWTSKGREFIHSLFTS